MSEETRKVVYKQAKCMLNNPETDTIFTLYVENGQLGVMLWQGTSSVEFAFKNEDLPSLAGYIDDFIKAQDPETLKREWPTSIMRKNDDGEWYRFDSTHPEWDEYVATHKTLFPQ